MYFTLLVSPGPWDQDLNEVLRCRSPRVAFRQFLQAYLGIRDPISRSWILANAERRNTVTQRHRAGKSAVPRPVDHEASGRGSSSYRV